MENMRELHLGEETIRKQRIPSGRKPGFISGSGLGTACLLTNHVGQPNKTVPL